MAGYGCPMVQVGGSELGAGGDAEFGVDAAQVCVDGAGSEEHLAGGLPGAGADRDEPGDLEFLRGELLGGAWLARACCLAGCSELGAGLSGPGVRAEPLEQVHGGTQVLARAESFASAAQPFSVEQFGLRPVKWPRRGEMEAERSGEVGQAASAGASSARRRACMLRAGGDRVAAAHWPKLAAAEAARSGWPARTLASVKHGTACTRLSGSAEQRGAGGQHDHVGGAYARCFGGRGVRQRQGAAARGMRGLGSPGLCAARSYGNRPELIRFLHILAVSDREDVRGGHWPLT